MMLCILPALNYNAILRIQQAFISNITCIWKIKSRREWIQEERRKLAPDFGSHLEQLILKEPDDRQSILETLDIYRSLPPSESPPVLTIAMLEELRQKYSASAKLSFLRYHGRKYIARRDSSLNRGFIDIPTPKRSPHPYGVLFDPKTKTVIYGEKNNTITLHYESIQNSDPLRKLRAASLFGQKLVIDFSFNHMMRQKEHSSLATQICLISSANRSSADPFDIIFTNFEGNRHFMEAFKMTSGEKVLINCSLH